MWTCDCLCCGRTDVVVSQGNLITGHTKSCGCLSAKTTSILNKRFNKYDISCNYGVGITRNTNKEFYFDLDDYEKIKYHCWNEGKRGYLVCVINKKLITMHKFLLNYPICDHINRNKLDNRKENLRPARHVDNDRNRSLLKRNTSGVTGVSWDKKREKWRAYIKTETKWIQLGRFQSKDDAITARLAAEKKYFGEFSPQKHLFEEYNIY